MLNCFLFEKFYLHYAPCDFDSILLHYAKLFIRQSIDREQISDVTFEKPPLKNPAYATGLEALRPKTSKCVLKDVVEAKDVLEDSTSIYHVIERKTK